MRMSAAVIDAMAYLLLIDLTDATAVPDLSQCSRHVPGLSLVDEAGAYWGKFTDRRVIGVGQTGKLGARSGGRPSVAGRIVGGQNVARQVAPFPVGHGRRAACTRHVLGGLDRLERPALQNTGSRTIPEWRMSCRRDSPGKWRSSPGAIGASASPPPSGSPRRAPRLHHRPPSRPRSTGPRGRSARTQRPSVATS